MRIFFSVLVIYSVSAASADLDRRQALKIGFFSTFVGMFVKPPAQVIPAPTTPRAPVISMERGSSGFKYRTAQLEHYLSNVLHWGKYTHDTMTFFLKPQHLDILEDWMRHNPDRSQEVRQDLDEYKTVSRSLPLEMKLAQKTVEEVFLEYKRILDLLAPIQARIIARVDRTPWSTWNWYKVFAPQIAAIEVRLGSELGDVDLTEVHKATEQLLILTDSKNPLRSTPTIGYINDIIHLVSSDEFDHGPVPLYSIDFVERFYNAIREIAPWFAEIMYNQNFTAGVDSVTIKKQLIDVIANGRYQDLDQFASSHLRFSFNQFRFYSRLAPILKPEDLAIEYVAALQKCKVAKVRFEKLQPSPLKTAYLMNLEILISEIEEELATLNSRLTAFYNSKNGEQIASSPSSIAKQDFDDPELPVHARVGALHEVIRWAQYLKRLNVTIDSVDAAAHAAESALTNLANKSGSTTHLNNAQPCLALIDDQTQHLTVPTLEAGAVDTHVSNTDDNVKIGF